MRVTFKGKGGQDRALSPSKPILFTVTPILCLQDFHPHFGLDDETDMGTVTLTLNLNP